MNYEDTPEINVQHLDMLKFYKGVLLTSETESYIQSIKKFKKYDALKVLDVGGGPGKIGFLLEHEFDFTPEKDFEYHNVDLNPEQLKISPGHTYLDDRVNIDKLFKDKKFQRIFYLFPTLGYKKTDDGKMENIDVHYDFDFEHVATTYFLPILKMMKCLDKNGVLTVAHFEYVDLQKLFIDIDHPNSGLEILQPIRATIPDTVYSKTGPGIYLPKVDIFRFKKVVNKDDFTSEKIIELEQLLNQAK